MAHSPLRRAFLSVSLLAAVPWILPADTTPPTEYEVKAAFLYNFAKFVEWPADVLNRTPGLFVIGILGDDPFGEELDRLLDGKTVQDRKLVLRRITTVQEASTCEVLFVSATGAGRAETILAAIRDLPILTVGEKDLFIQKGGMVGFNVEENRVRFSINAAAAAKADLKISSQLLKLAKTVISRSPSSPLFPWIS